MLNTLKFKENLKSSIKLFNTLPRKFFTEPNKINEKEIIIENNSQNSDEIDIKIPDEFESYYTFGTFKKLALFNNTSDFNKYKLFMPLNKFNIVIFSIYTYMSYGSALFQPSLFITLYTLNKYFLNTIRKEMEIIFIALNEDCKSLTIKTFYAEFLVDLIDTQISEKKIKLSSNTYYEFKNSKINHPLYFKADAQILSAELMERILTGEVSKVNLIYEKNKI
jgi:hypothetical protein